MNSTLLLKRIAAWIIGFTITLACLGVWPRDAFEFILVGFWGTLEGVILATGLTGLRACIAGALVLITISMLMYGSGGWWALLGLTLGPGIIAGALALVVKFALEDL